MTARPIPTRHWRSYGTDPLPTGREALDEPFRAFPSWFMRITCDRCGKDRMLNETHTRAERHADPRHHRPHASRRLRRQGREGGAAHRHRGRQQPAGVQTAPGAGGVMGIADTILRACWHLSDAPTGPILASTAEMTSETGLTAARMRETDRWRTSRTGNG